MKEPRKLDCSKLDCVSSHKQGIETKSSCPGHFERCLEQKRSEDSQESRTLNIFYGEYLFIIFYLISIRREDAFQISWN